MTQQEDTSYRDKPFVAEALAYIYIAQLGRPDGHSRAGVLESDCQRYAIQIRELLTSGDVQKAKWGNLVGFITTARGTQKACEIVNDRVLTSADHLRKELEAIPRRFVQYFHSIVLADEPRSNRGREVYIDKNIQLYDSSSRTNQNPSYLCLLSNTDVRDMRDRLFQLLTTLKLVVKAFDYVGTRGGEERNLLFIPTPELQTFFEDYLAKVGLFGNLWPEELEEMHSVFHILANLSTREELDRYVPVRYRESVNQFIDECITKNVVKESTNTASPYLAVNDLLWYDTERAKRYQKPLLDFLLGQNYHPNIEAIEESVGDAIVEAPKKRVEVPKKDEGASSPEKVPQETHPTQLAILLGVSDTDDVFWVPASEHNWNFAIVGAVGTGKTQTVMAVLKELARKQVPYLVFDFKGDYVRWGPQHRSSVLYSTWDRYQLTPWS